MGFMRLYLSFHGLVVIILGKDYARISILRQILSEIPYQISFIILYHFIYTASFSVDLPVDHLADQYPSNTATKAIVLPMEQQEKER